MPSTSRVTIQGSRFIRARGFSLLEVLVAFVILSLVATALFRLFSGSLANASAADIYSRAVLVAESVLADAAAQQPLHEDTKTGISDVGVISWTTRVTQYSPEGVSADLERASDLMPTRLYRITSEVTFPGPSGSPRTFSLATVRVATKDLNAK